MTLASLIAIIQGSVEMGIIYAIMTLGVFLSFRTLNMPDMTVDGSFVLGAAISAVLCTNGYPVLGLIIAFFVGWSGEHYSPSSHQVKDTTVAGRHTYDAGIVLHKYKSDG